MMQGKDAAERRMPSIETTGRPVTCLARVSSTSKAAVPDIERQSLAARSSSSKGWTEAAATCPLSVFPDCRRGVIRGCEEGHLVGRAASYKREPKAGDPRGAEPPHLLPPDAHSALWRKLLRKLKEIGG